MNTEQRNNASKTMLGLKLPTDPRWVNVAEKNIGEILVDHAYCEQKAASSCISLIIQFPEKERLREILMPVVSEEWAHFRMVLKEMDTRGIKFGNPRRDEYVHQLYAAMKRGGTRDEQLGERLFMNALIEARSCERFRILSQEISDINLREFYHELMISEAGHYVNFIDLAKEYLSTEYVKKRWAEWLEIEAQVIENLEVRGDRVH
jgi:tRNA 2-(methylsulfanyl)-N6-isopentenyladenosine37 hydroxylase